ncbi:dienelactone hydrolase [Xylariaceae sp. FL0662B]|nr:dienelactone hydrolase [Xylariaceae sp. FL0662B]
MASNAPARCCAVGIKENGKPGGQYATLAGIDAYIAKPSKDTGKGVLLLTDILGHKFPNSQLLADSFAENGYTTVVPDLFHGDPVPLEPPSGFDFMAWLTKGTDNKGSHLPDRVDPVVSSIIKVMRTELGITKLGAAGYCFGAKPVVRFLKHGQIDVGFCAHPSFVEIFPVEKRRETEDLLIAHKDKLPYQINLYSGTVHGFAVRGDTSVKQIAFAKTAAFVQAVQWFEEYL